MSRRERGLPAVYMEILIDFRRTYRSRLHSVVFKLQGIREESEVRTVACRLQFERRQARFYMKAGWRNFAEENNLEVGQEISFTLTGDSFFVVRESSGATTVSYTGRI